MAQKIRWVKLRDQVAERVAQTVFSGGCPEGDRLPPGRKLA